ncbi:MAG: molecular chaperone DnaK, partial [Alphaproteobacteria bacterium]
IADLRSAMQDENAGEAELAPKIQALMTVSMKVGEAMYRPQEEADGAGHAAGDDSVVDADFEEIDETKKD